MSLVRVAPFFAACGAAFIMISAGRSMAQAKEVIVVGGGTHQVVQVETISPTNPPSDEKEPPAATETEAVETTAVTETTSPSPETSTSPAPNAVIPVDNKTDNKTPTTEPSTEPSEEPTSSYTKPVFAETPHGGFENIDDEDVLFVEYDITLNDAAAQEGSLVLLLKMPTDSDYQEISEISKTYSGDRTETLSSSDPEEKYRPFDLYLSVPSEPTGFVLMAKLRFYYSLPDGTSGYVDSEAIGIPVGYYLWANTASCDSTGFTAPFEVETNIVTDLQNLRVTDAYLEISDTRRIDLKNKVSISSDGLITVSAKFSEILQTGDSLTAGNYYWVYLETLYTTPEGVQWTDYDWNDFKMATTYTAPVFSTGPSASGGADYVSVDFAIRTNDAAGQDGTARVMIKTDGEYAQAASYAYEPEYYYFAPTVNPVEVDLGGKTGAVVWARVDFDYEFPDGGTDVLRSSEMPVGVGTFISSAGSTTLVSSGFAVPFTIDTSIVDPGKVTGVSASINVDGEDIDLTDKHEDGGTWYTLDASTGAGTIQASMEFLTPALTELGLSMPPEGQSYDVSFSMKYADDDLTWTCDAVGQLQMLYLGRYVLESSAAEYGPSGVVASFQLDNEIIHDYEDTLTCSYTLVKGSSEYTTSASDWHEEWSDTSDGLFLTLTYTAPSGSELTDGSYTVIASFSFTDSTHTNMLDSGSAEFTIVEPVSPFGTGLFTYDGSKLSGQFPLASTVTAADLDNLSFTVSGPDAPSVEPVNFTHSSTDGFVGFALSCSMDTSKSYTVGVSAKFGDPALPFTASAPVTMSTASPTITVTVDGSTITSEDVSAYGQIIFSNVSGHTTGLSSFLVNWYNSSNVRVQQSYLALGSGYTIGASDPASSDGGATLTYHYGFEDLTRYPGAAYFRVAFWGMVDGEEQEGVLSDPITLPASTSPFSSTVSAEHTYSSDPPILSTSGTITITYDPSAFDFESAEITELYVTGVSGAVSEDYWDVSSANDDGNGTITFSFSINNLPLSDPISPTLTFTANISGMLNSASHSETIHPTGTVSVLYTT